jgi:hypothetical protein
LRLRFTQNKIPGYAMAPVDLCVNSNYGHWSADCRPRFSSVRPLRKTFMRPCLSRIVQQSNRWDQNSETKCCRERDRDRERKINLHGVSPEKLKTGGRLDVGCPQVSEANRNSFVRSWIKRQTTNDEQHLRVRV